MVFHFHFALKSSRVKLKWDTGYVAVRCLNWNVNFLNYCEDPVEYFLSALHGST